ncbi:MAG: hypothetical protein J0H14_16170 [Alphaproteobacteria bacterium]|nr:hypothetical protein [Alphaproteobacteria bacterium]
MGGFVEDNHVPGILWDLNQRFGPGDGINEMVALQQNFAVFSPQHSLRDSFSLLNIGPVENWRQRRGWYVYLDSLKAMPSDEPGKYAHDRLIEVLDNNLRSANPQPVHFTVHSISDDPGLRVSAGAQPLAYSVQVFLTISFPTDPLKGAAAATG